MPTVNDEFNRTIARIDLDPDRSGIFSPVEQTIRFTAADLQRFNDCVARVAAGTPVLDERHVLAAARRLARVVGEGQESLFIRARMRRAGEIRALLADAAWKCADDLRVRMRDIVDYMDGGPGLVPDDVPVIGGLDDALLLDLAMEQLRGELDEYADFCRYRVGEAARAGVDPGAVQIDRARWAREREEEIRIERQLRQAREGSFVRGDAGAALFRVG